MSSDNGKRNRNAKEPRRVKPTITWAQVDAEIIKAFIVACTDFGVGATFSRTINGDTLSMTALAGDQKPRGYASTLSEVPYEMGDILWELDLDIPEILTPSGKGR